MNVPAHIDLTEGRVLLIDKPLRWTSFSAVNRMKRTILDEILKDIDDPQERRRLKKRLKVGHAGTLDPLATGLLVLCTGPKTKTILSIQSQEKEYTGTIVLGAVTPTFDLESTPEQFKSIEGISKEMIRTAVESLTGTIEQLPPAHSAVKVGGQRAYELARKGKEVVISPKKVEIKVFEITGIELPTLTFRVVCSKGTYIRSLANDLGRALGCGAHLGSLRRERIGDYHVDQAVKPG